MLLPVVSMKSIASCKVSLLSINTTLFLCVITSLACLSLSSKIFVIISASEPSKIPCSCPSFNILTISSSLTVSACAFISTPKSFNIIYETPSITHIIGDNKNISTADILIKVYTLFLGTFLANLFGKDIPKITKRIQKTTTTIKIEIPLESDTGKAFDSLFFIILPNVLIKYHPRKLTESMFTICVQ